jgi:tetratricopeptide (TPR) repeat protein
LEAIAFYRSALTQAQKAGTDLSQKDQSASDLIAQLHEGLGDVLELNGEIEEARRHFEEARALISETDRTGRSRLYRKFGATWVIRRDYEKTFALFLSAEEELEAEKSDRSVNWWDEWAQIQLDRMHLFYWLGMAKELNALASGVRERLEKHGTSAQRGKFFTMLALSLLTEHHYAPPEIAVEHAERAVRAGKDCDNPTELVHLRFPLGLIQLWRGNFDAAILELGRALQLSEKAGDIVLQARCLVYLAVAHRRAGVKSIAQSYAERAISTATKLELAQYIAMGNATLAWVAWKDGDLSRVEAHAHDALDQWHSMPDPYGVDWMALWPLIAVEHEQKSFSTAIEHMRALFGPNQHPLPALLASAVERAIQAADTKLNSVEKFIAAALTAARDAHQL